MYFSPEFWQYQPRFSSAVQWIGKVVRSYREAELERLSAIYDIPGAYTAPIPPSTADERDQQLMRTAPSAFIFDRIVGDPAVTEGEIGSKQYHVPEHVYGSQEDAT